MLTLRIRELEALAGTDHCTDITTWGSDMIKDLLTAEGGLSEIGRVTSRSDGMGKAKLFVGVKTGRLYAVTRRCNNYYIT